MLRKLTVGLLAFAVFIAAATVSWVVTDAIAATFYVNGKATAPQPVSLFHPNGWVCNQSAISSETECKAAPGSGSTLHVTGGILSASAAITISITTGTGTNCGTGNGTLIGAHYFGTNTGTTLDMADQLDVASNTAVCCKPSGASGTCTLYGYTTTP